MSIQSITVKTDAEVLANFKPPVRAKRPIPYVLMVRIGKMYVHSDKPEIEGDYKEVDYTQEFCLDISGTHAQKSILQYYIDEKGFKPIKYWIGGSREAVQTMGAMTTITSERPAHVYSEIEDYLEKSLGRIRALEEKDARIAELEAQLSKKPKGGNS